jgi:hypothetical protein
MSKDCYNLWIEKESTLENTVSAFESYSGTSKMTREVVSKSTRRTNYRVISEQEFKHKLRKKLIYGIAGLVIGASMAIYGYYLDKNTKMKDAVINPFIPLSVVVAGLGAYNIEKYMLHSLDERPNLRTVSWYDLM